MKRKKNGAISGAGWKQLLSVWCIVAVTFFVLVFAMILATAPERYDLKVGDIAPETITATKEVIDETLTEQNRQKAADAVQPVYQEDATALETVMKQLTQIFNEYEAVRFYGENLRLGLVESAAGEDFQYSGTFVQQDRDQAKTLSTLMPLSDWQTNILMKQDKETLESLFTITSGAIQSVMEATIREGQLETAINTIQKQIIQYTSSDLCWNLAIPAVRATLIPNMVVNQEATEVNRQAARDSVEPVYYKIGQNIVVAGERIGTAQLAVLESLGLLEGNLFDIKMMVGVCILACIVFLAMLLHTVQFGKKLVKNERAILLLSVIILVSMLFCALAGKINPYLAPVSMVVLLVTALVSSKISIIFNFAAAIFAGVLASAETSGFSQMLLNIVIANTLSGFVGIYMIRRNGQRTSVLIAGLAVALVNCVTMVALGFLTNNVMKSVIENAFWSAGGCLLASMLCMGIQPILEYLFNLATPYKLLELANPNQPLLHRLLTETPGTYHHSIMVANLAEAAADSIGANSLLVRAGAYYHDIGKLKRPQYFKENQRGENPHDHTDPQVSAAIIIAHVSDGVELARQHRLPQAVVDCIAQHHGTTAAAYFYVKACEQANGAEVDKNDFTYPGPRPQTEEAGLLMLADTVEAAIRAAGELTTEEMEKRVRELVKGKVDSGQLDDTSLTYRDVIRICEAFVQVLNGIYHKRIEYPKLEAVRQALMKENDASKAVPVPASAKESEKNED